MPPGRATHRRSLFLFGFPVVAVAAAICVGILGTATVAAKGDGSSTLSAKMDGKALGADKDGRGTVLLELKSSKRKVCYSIDANEVEKGRVYIGEGAKGDRGRSVLTLFDPGVKNSRLKGCVGNVSRSLIANLAAHPKQFFVAISNREFRKGAIRGQLRPSAKAPGDASPNYSATDCFVYLDDDTGEGHDFATGQSTTPKPIDGAGVRYLAGEDHSVTTCIVSRTYNFPKGTVKIYAKDRLIGSNVYSCVTTGIYKCFGPRAGSTTSGWTLRVIYYVCIPGASTLPGYCPK